MKQKFGIRKTKTNIFWLLVLGLLIGVVLGLRHQGPTLETTESTVIETTTEK